MHINASHIARPLPHRPEVTTAHSQDETTTKGPHDAFYQSQFKQASLVGGLVGVVPFLGGATNGALIFGSGTRNSSSVLAMTALAGATANMAGAITLLNGGSPLVGLGLLAVSGISGYIAAGPAMVPEAV